MNRVPLISVLIPVYNVEKYIERCLVSLFNNTIIKDCEIVIVDDCSPDSSMKVIHSVLEKFPAMKEQIALHSHDYNRGSAAARNTALLHSHGKYIICVDSDDWVEKDYLEKLYKTAQESNADVVMCDLVKKTREESLVISEEPKYDDFLASLLSGSLHGWLHEKLIKHSLFMEYKLCWIEGLNMCEDLLIMAKVFLYTKKVVHIKKALYHYDCTNQTSLSSNLDFNKVKQLKQVIIELENFLPQKYSEFLKVQKSRIKVWILKDQKRPQKDDFLLYNSDYLSKCKLNPMTSRFFFWLCEHHFFCFAKFILKLKK